MKNKKIKKTEKEHISGKGPEQPFTFTTADEREKIRLEENVRFDEVADKIVRRIDMAFLKRRHKVTWPIYYFITRLIFQFNFKKYINKMMIKTKKEM